MAAGQGNTVREPDAVFANACDCHMHVYDSRYPAAPGATLLPPDATVSAYRAVQRRQGTTRTVVVTPSTYGLDNACTLDAIAQLGGEARGVAVVGPDVGETELDTLHRAGIRGIRFNLTMPGPLDLSALPGLAARIAPLGWHVQLNIPAGWLTDIAATLRALPVAVVFDHYGHLPFGRPEGEKGYAVIADLVQCGKAWVKLSAPYIETLDGPPAYRDAARLASRYTRLAPDRMVWGSDWPHPTVQAAGGDPIDDRSMLALFREWCASDAVARQVLVHNPKALYGFDDG